MSAEIGSIEAGKRADIIIINTSSPYMVTDSDPAAALVLHACPADVETVFVNGEVVKENGKLLKVDWPRLKHQLLQSIAGLEAR